MKLPYLQARGEAWDKARMRALVRDDFTCQFAALGLPEIKGGCTHQLPESRLRHLVVHHKEQRQHGGTHDLDNLITVCHAHHAEIHPHLRFELETKERGLEGWALREL